MDYTQFPPGFMELAVFLFYLGANWQKMGINLYFCKKSLMLRHAGLGPVSIFALTQ